MADLAGYTDAVRRQFSLPFQERPLLWRLLSPETVVTAFSFMLADLIDKPLWVLGVIGDGRFVTHSLLAGVLVAGAFYMVKPAYGWFSLSGGMVHRLFDIFGWMPWWYPFKSYEWPTYDYHKVVTWYAILFTLVEMAVVVVLVSLGVAAAMSLISRVRKVPSQRS